MNAEWTGATDAGAQTNLNADDKIASLFQPDMLLSAQYFGNLRRKTHLEPEKRLMLALLEDAINCYQDTMLSRRPKKRRLFEETEKWILEVGGDWIFSFDSVCETLGLNPDYVRQGLLRWKERIQSGLRRPEFPAQTKLSG
jgi:hypothetical protein